VYSKHWSIPAKYCSLEYRIFDTLLHISKTEIS